MPAGNLRSYNIGAHRLTIPSNVTLRGEAVPTTWRNMGYDPRLDPGFANMPHGIDPPWVNVEDELWQDRGDAPQDGTIIEYTGTDGPAIHIFRAKGACVRELCIVAMNLPAIEPVEDPSYQPVLEFRISDTAPSAPLAPDWKNFSDLILDPVSHMWKTEDPGSNTILFLNESNDVIGPAVNQPLTQSPFFRIRWLSAVDPNAEYDPQNDSGLIGEANAPYTHWACTDTVINPVCALHVNGAWHSRFENLVFFVPKKSVAIMVDPFLSDALDQLGDNVYFNNPDLTQWSDNNGPYQAYHPYFLAPPPVPNTNPPVPTNEPSTEDIDTLTVSTDQERVCGWGTYACHFSTINAFNGAIVISGSDPINGAPGSGLTTCTFRDIWARRYVLRHCMGITLTNCTAEGFSGYSPAFPELTPAAMDHRITAPDGEGNPTAAGWWDELIELFYATQLMLFNGREAGYMLAHATSVQLVGCDIEDWAGKACIILGEGVDNFNGVGVATGLYSATPNSAPLVGKPLRAGQFVPTAGPQVAWGHTEFELARHTPYDTSSGSNLVIGSANADAVDNAQPYQFRLRARSPRDTTDGSGVAYPSGATAQQMYPQGHPRQMLELSRVTNADEMVCIAVDHADRTDTVLNRSGIGTLIRLDTGETVDTGTGCVDLCGDTILLRGMPVFTHSSRMQGNVPSSLQGVLPGTVQAWLPVYIRTAIDPDNPAGGTFEKYYIPLYQP